VADAPPGALVARILHGGLTAGLVLFGAACYVLRGGRPPGALPSFIPWIPLGLAAVVFPAAVALRSRLFDATTTAPGEWWNAHLTHAILLWSLFEGPALFGAAVYLASGGIAALGATAVGLALLLLHAPDRLSIAG
jgi:hypothetical protein